MPHVASLSIAIFWGFPRTGSTVSTKDGPLRLRHSWSTLTLHLSEHKGGGTECASLFVSVDDVDAVYKEFVDKGLVPEGPPIDRDYGVRDFSFRDPDGHHIGFGTRLN
ncbi:MAG: glyoxalase superfamily protein [Candidatus Poribacteria bacterium]